MLSSVGDTGVTSGSQLLGRWLAGAEKLRSEKLFRPLPGHLGGRNIDVAGRTRRTRKYKQDTLDFLLFDEAGEAQVSLGGVFFSVFSGFRDAKTS